MTKSLRNSPFKAMFTIRVVTPNASAKAFTDAESRRIFLISLFVLIYLIFSAPSYQESVAKESVKFYTRKIEMDKISPIKKRILQYIDYVRISRIDFCEKVGMSYANMKGKGLESEIGGTQIVKILSQSPDLSPEWLLTGKGAMLRGQSAPEVAPPPSEPAFPGLIEKIQDLSVKVGRLEAENEHLRAAIEAKQREIEAQQREIEAQRREIEARQKEIEDKERQIKLMRIDHLKKEEPDIHTQYLEPAHAPLPPENPVESAELLKSQPQEALFTP